MSDEEVILDKKDISMHTPNFLATANFQPELRLSKLKTTWSMLLELHLANFPSCCVHCYQLQFHTFVEQEHQLKKRLDILYKESLMYKRSWLEHILETTLIN